MSRLKHDSIDVTVNYRMRIYESYVTARDMPLAPATAAGLRPRLPYLRRIIERHFPPERGSAILELGCGHGALLYALQRARSWNAKGVDGSPEQVNAARKLGIDGVREGGVMETLEATTASSLDVVVAFDLIEHFTKSELIPLVDEVQRVLRPGGQWIIHTPNAEGPFGSRMRYWDFTHEVAFTRVSITQLLKSSGFAQVFCHEDRPVPHGLKSLIRALAWRLIRVGLRAYVAIETGSWDGDMIFSQNLLVVAVKATPGGSASRSTQHYS